ncbi:MAG: histidine kinase [Burkholderiaceae bacterium]|nr:histidine kinase [Burkholderiaceae bacterium]
MHHRRTAYAVLAAWLLFWALMIVTAVFDMLRDGESGWWKPVLWESSSALTATALLLLQRRATRQYDHLLDQPWRWFGRQLLWAPVYWATFVPIAFAMRHGVYALAGDTYRHGGWAQTFLYEDIKITVFFGIFVVIQFGLLSYRALMEEKLRAEQAAALLRQAQLQQLTRQMQPHFLFNALNTISSLIHTDADRADALLLRLSDMLRATLDHGERQQVPLADELRLLRGYAQLMGERFADRVHIAWHVDDTALACAVPPMSMQPLLENVFKHTVEQRRQPVRITVAALRDGAELVLRIEDDCGRLAADSEVSAAAQAPAAAAPATGTGTAAAAASASGSAQSGGVGLRNLRRRLVALHGDAASLRLLQLAPAGVRAEMRLPCGC